MIILERPVGRDELQCMAEKMFGDMVKGVVDIRRDKLALDAELHADLETLLLEDGSAQEDLWGINLYPEEEKIEDFLEFDSLINIRPRQNNRGRGVYDESVRKEIRALISRWVK